MAKVKLFIGLITAKSVDKHLLESKISQLFGKIECRSDEFDFSHTAYYKDEMGDNLKKIFLVINPLISEFESYLEKIKAVKLENEFMVNNKRTVNIDPGTLSAHNVILLTTKNYAHRIPLNKNIYAELTYTFKDKNYSVLPWSYPDFGTSNYLSFFEDQRMNYLKQLRGHND